MTYVILMRNSLNKQSHESCSEEESEAIFEPKWELETRGSFMALKVGEIMKQSNHAQFIEQNNEE